MIMSGKNAVAAVLILILVCNALVVISVSSSVDRMAACDGTSDKNKGDDNLIRTRFAGGDGSEGNPYQISNATQLMDINLDTSAHYVLINDIDATETKSWNGNAGFAPVGKSNDQFKGSLDGQDYNISGLWINRGQSESVGVFAYIYYGSIIDNVHLLDINVSGGSRTGGLVGNNHGMIRNCSVLGNISGNFHVGGLVGQNDQSGHNDANMENCNAKVNVSGVRYVGGLVGQNYATIENCYDVSSVKGDFFIGGVVGVNSEGFVRNCYGAGNVSGNKYSGVLVGSNSAIIENSYANGDASGNNAVGVLVGYNYGTIEDSYSNGNVSGCSDVGGLIGRNEGTIDNSFYCINYSVVNNSHFITPYGMYKKQFEDWFNNGKAIKVDDYLSKVHGKNRYMISSVADLKKMLPFGVNDQIDYIQTSDLDISSETSFYIPVIRGNYEGSHYNISGLNLTYYNNSRVGMFGNALGGVQNLSLVQCRVSGNLYSGGIAGYGQGTISKCNVAGRIKGHIFVGMYAGWISGTITDCNTSIDIRGGMGVGGIVGKSNSGTIVNCFCEGNVSGYDDYVGGVVGYSHDTTILDCYATGNVSGNSYVGGLGGKVEGSVKNCYAKGSVGGYSYVGGLIGYKLESMSKSYASGPVNGSSRVGGLVGYNYDGEITECHAVGQVFGENNDIGGLIGYNRNGDISDCHGAGDVVGVNRCIGGLVGRNEYADISECYAIGDVTGAGNVGGLIGNNDNGITSKCYAGGDVVGNRDDVGGLIGKNYRSTVSDCYSTGEVLGNTNIGGFIGYNGLATFSYCYSIGKVTGTRNVGGLVGCNVGGTDLSSFWDVQTSGQQTSDGGTSKNTAQMKTGATFTDGGWDLSTTWKIIEGQSCPYLRSMNYLDITKHNNESIFEGDRYRTDYDALKLLPGNPPLTWQLSTNATDWLQIDENGVLFGVPENDDVGTFSVKVTATYNVDFSDDTEFTLTVYNINDAPEITTPPTMIIYEDIPFHLDYDAVDIDPTHDELRWTFGTNAPFLWFNTTSGILNGTPSNSHVGSWWVNVTVEDDKGGTDIRNYTLTVINTNDPPEINTAPIRTFNEDDPYYLVWNAVDIDPTRDTMSWNLKSNASFLTMDPQAGILSGTPTNADVGTWWVNVTVNDGNDGTDSINYTLTVNNTNDAPEVNTTEMHLQIKEDTVFQGIRLDDVFLDIDGDTLYYCHEPCDNITIEILPNSSVVLTPMKDWCGVAELVFNANDTEMDVSVHITVTVSAVNDPPVNATIVLQNFTYHEGGPQPASAIASDADVPYGDSLQFMWKFNTTENSLRGKDVNLSLPAGTHLVTLMVSDEMSASNETTMEISILAAGKQDGADIPDQQDDDDTDDDDTGDDDAGGDDDGNGEDEGTSTGSMLYTGIGIGVAVLVVMAILALLLVMRKRSGKRNSDPEAAPVGNSNPAVVSVPVTTTVLDSGNGPGMVSSLGTVQQQGGYAPPATDLSPLAPPLAVSSVDDPAPPPVDILPVSTAVPIKTVPVPTVPMPTPFPALLPPSAPAPVEQPAEAVEDESPLPPPPT